MTETWAEMKKRHKEERRKVMIDEFHAVNGNTKLAAYNMGMATKRLRKILVAEFGGVYRLKDRLGI